MKKKCVKCGRNVGVKGGMLAKHRVGCSKPSKIKPVCEGSGKEAKIVV